MHFKQFFRLLAYYAAPGNARRRAGIFAHRQIPIPGRFAYQRFFHQQQRSDDHKFPAEKGVLGGQSVHAASLDHVHEKSGHQVFGRMPESQVRQIIVAAQAEQSLTAQPRAIKTG